MAEHRWTASRAVASTNGDRSSVGDGAVAMEWTLLDGHLSGVVLHDLWNGTTVPLPEPFAVVLRDGTKWNAANLRADGAPAMQALLPRPNAARAADRREGQQFTVALRDDAGRVRITWSVVLRDRANSIRQSVTITAGAHDLPISEVKLVDVALPGARVVGSVKGSPIVAGPLFLGFEDPLSHSEVTAGRATASVDRELPLRAGQSVTYSSVMGTTRPGQLRRDFLAYIEQERAHPYRPFLHYNSWYDLGYFTPYDEAGAVGRIRAFGTELHEKRGVTLDSFLFDDGWDNHASLWSFNSGFPNGFSPVRAAAAQIGAAPGLWLSPWGGYDGPKEERVKFGEKQGYEIVDGGFALSGPKYYRHFLAVCLEMIRKYGVNQFKFDGTGNADSVFPGSAFDSDFDAALHLIAALREAEPNLFVNLTTGTYPSPFWLLDADSTWRGGDDDNETGVGTTRERWITYRDAQTYRNIVQAGPLYPLNSLMLHGIIFARFNKQLNSDPGNDFRNEVRSYFGTGTQCQEMYITPSLLSQANWDDLAEAASWSRTNAETLRDTHWVGGDPARLKVYGWAAWSPHKGILTLRNPSDRAQTIRIDAQDAFELPEGAARAYSAASPWKEDAGQAPMPVRAGEPHEFHLAPFQVLTLEFTPQGSGTARGH
ncbi:MAG TPA: enterotoxin [Acidobacteriaceae bacterium]